MHKKKYKKNPNKQIKKKLNVSTYGISLRVVCGIGPFIDTIAKKNITHGACIADNDFDKCAIFFIAHTTQQVIH